MDFKSMPDAASISDVICNDYTLLVGKYENRNTYSDITVYTDEKSKNEFGIGTYSIGASKAPTEQDIITKEDAEQLVKSMRFLADFLEYALEKVYGISCDNNRGQHEM